MGKKSFLGDFLDGQAKNKSNSALLHEARSSFSSGTGDSRIDDAHKRAARKELLSRGYNPKTGKFEK